MMEKIIKYFTLTLLLSLLSLLSIKVIYASLEKTNYVTCGCQPNVYGSSCTCNNTQSIKVPWGTSKVEIRCTGKIKRCDVAPCRENEALNNARPIKMDIKKKGDISIYDIGCPAQEVYNPNVATHMKVTSVTCGGAGYDPNYSDCETSYGT